MTARRLTTGLALGALVSLALAGHAAAATKTVVAGAGKGTATMNDFFPRKVAIHQGDTVSFSIQGFHNVYFPKKGGKSAPLFVPDKTTKYSGLSDAAGDPLWFNGVADRVTISPLSAFPIGGSAYDGSAPLGSGIHEGAGAPPPFDVTFAKKGSFTYYCTIHPGMKGQVSVLPRSSRIPTAAQDKRTAGRQLTREVRLAKRLDRRRTPKDTIRGGSDKNPVNHLKFYPANLRVKAGQAITFTVNPRNQEPHTLSIGPQAFLAEVVQSQITPVPNPAGPPTLVFDGRALLPSDPPSGKTPAVFDGAAHGGFFSTGVLGARSSKTRAVRFRITKPGAYDYICLIHPDMHGRITVK